MNIYMSTLEASNNNNNILTTEREYFSLKKERKI